MLGFGLLAVFSLGLAGVLSGGDSDASDEQEVFEAPDEPATDPEVSASEDLAPIDTLDVGGVEAPDSNLADPEPAAPAPEPVLEAPADPVSIVLADGSEVAEETVLTEGPLSGADADRSFLLTAPEGAHEIRVDYDPETTYAIAYNADTTQITAALNSNISGPDGSDTQASEQLVDEDGTAFTETIITREFEGATHITLIVEPEHIGEHVAQIDLSNPNDTLDFRFSKMQPNMHLHYDENDTMEGDTFVTTRTLYVIETPFEFRSLPASVIEGIVDQGLDSTPIARLVAEVHLGHSELTLEGDGSSDAPFRQTIGNFVNDVKDIGNNYFWRSNNAYDAVVSDPESAAPEARVGVPPSEVVGVTNTAPTGSSGGNLATAPTAQIAPQVDPQLAPTPPQVQQDLSLSPEERARLELERANALLDQANGNLDSLGIRI